MNTLEIARKRVNTGAAAPLFLLPPLLYEIRLPKAKILVGMPMAVFDGKLAVDSQTGDVTDGVRSQDHNWG